MAVVYLATSALAWVFNNFNKNMLDIDALRRSSPYLPFAQEFIGEKLFNFEYKKITLPHNKTVG